MPFDPKASDVVLTTGRGATPALLRLIVGAPGKPRRRDDRAGLRHRSQGRRMRPVRDGWSGLHPQQGGVLLAPEDVAPLIVRGPPVVDEDKLVSFAVGIVESAPLFANAALAMAALDKPRTRAQRLALALAQSSAIMATPSLMTPAG